MDCAGFIEGLASFGQNVIEPPCSAVANGRTGPESRANKAFPFQSIERGLNRSGCDVPVESYRHLPKHRPPVSISVEPNDRQEHGLLEGAKDIRHYDYIVAIRSLKSTVRLENGTAALGADPGGGAAECMNKTQNGRPSSAFAGRRTDAA